MTMPFFNLSRLSLLLVPTTSVLRPPNSPPCTSAWSTISGFSKSIVHFGVRLIYFYLLELLPYLDRFFTPISIGSYHPISIGFFTRKDYSYLRGRVMLISSEVSFVAPRGYPLLDGCLTAGSAMAPPIAGLSCTLCGVIARTASLYLRP